MNPGSRKDRETASQRTRSYPRHTGSQDTLGSPRRIRAERRHLGSACRCSESEGESVLSRSHFSTRQVWVFSPRPECVSCNERLAVCVPGSLVRRVTSESFPMVPKLCFLRRKLPRALPSLPASAEALVTSVVSNSLRPHGL